MLYSNNFITTLAMHMRKRRECCVMGECLIFQAYEDASHRICSRYHAAAQRECSEGIRML